MHVREWPVNANNYEIVKELGKGAHAAVRAANNSHCSCYCCNCPKMLNAWRLAVSLLNAMHAEACLQLYSRH